MGKIIRFVKTKVGKAILIAALTLGAAIADLTANGVDNSVFGKLIELAETIETVETAPAE